MKKRTTAIILNLLIILFELVGFLYNYTYNHRIAVEFYTEDSNILALITSSIFVYYMLANNKIPKWLKSLKYISTVGLSVTFFVVLFILIPMANFNYYGFLFSGTMLYHHTLCPILGIITFLFFDNLKIYNKKDTITALSFTIIYAICAITLNILGYLEGPYPFLMVRKLGFIKSVIWFIVVFGFAYLIAYLLRIIHIKINGELLDVYNEEGKVINKTVLRGSDDSSFEKGEHFSVSVIFIENDKGEFLMQYLPDDKYSSTGGHVLSGEDPLSAVIRETKEEIGITLNKKDIKYIGYKVGKVPIRFLYYIKKNVDLNDVVIDKNELNSVEYMTKDQIKKLIRHGKMKKSHALLYKELLKYLKNNV